MRANTVVSKTAWTTLQPVSSKVIVTLLYAAIVVSLLTSCGNGPGIRVGYRGAMMEIGGQRGGQRGGRPMDGYQQHQQQSMPRLTAGQRLGLEVFGNQPKHPTPGAQRTDWASIFGPRGPMINDKGSYALVEHVPVGLRILYDPNFGAWKEDCGNRLLNVPKQQIQQQLVQRQYCPPQRRVEYCPPPQRRMIQYCPPPPCPPLRYQKWGPSYGGGYSGGGYQQQRRMW